MLLPSVSRFTVNWRQEMEQNEHKDVLAVWK